MDRLTEQEKFEFTASIPFIPPKLTFYFLIDSFLFLGLFRQATSHDEGLPTPEGSEPVLSESTRCFRRFDKGR